MQRFKNQFGVTGPFLLLKAFKEYAESIGWKYDSKFNEFRDRKDRNDRDFLYFFGGKEETASMLNQHFSLSGGDPKFNLEKQWKEACAYAAETEETDVIIKFGDYEPEYNSDGSVSFGCQTFSGPELKGIRKLLNAEIDANINIKGVNLDQTILNHIINKLK